MPADDTAATVAPLVLGYGDIAVQRGVTVTRDGASLRIRVPPPRLWALRNIKLVWLFVAIQTIPIPVGQFYKGNYGAGLAIAVIEVVVIAFLAARFTAHRRSNSSGTIFELTADTLHLSADKPPPGLLMTEGESCWTTTRPRRAITEVRYNPYDRALLIRAAGHNLLLGLLQNEDRRVIEYVAETLTAELATAAPKLTT